MGLPVEGLAVSSFKKVVKATVNDQADHVGLTINSGADFEDLRALVEREYGIAIRDSRSLGGELDTNIWIRDTENREFTIKRSMCEDPSEIRWQYPVLERLHDRLSGIQVPTLIATAEGELDVVVPAEARYAVIRLAHWVPGDVIASQSQMSERILKDWGLLAANTILALSDFEPSSVPHAHYWDLRQTLDSIRSCIDFVPDSENRMAVEKLMQRGPAYVEELCQLPKQVVHQDLNDFNVIVNNDTSDARITGLLDVGDTVFAPRLSELIVAAAYAMLRQPDPLSAADLVISGYSDVLPLNNGEIDLVRHLAALRLCVNATTWTKRAALEGTEYGVRRMAATWPTISLLAESINK
jgi:Ser/Thr protein kinase RdoA (MazF antagonist)